MNYLIESSISMMLLYGLYFFVFRSFTFIRLNRVYLLLSLLFSLLIPTFTWEVKEVAYSAEELANYVRIYSLKQFNEFGNIGSEVTATKSVAGFNWMNLLFVSYWLGFVLMLGRIIVLLFKLINLKKEPSQSYISNTGKFANSSFFNLIFIDDSHLEKAEIAQVLAHERWHGRLFHSYDLLFVELVKIAFWFNPIVYFYQRSLAEVHEYEVDSRMIKQYHPQTYAHLLLKLAGLKVQPMMMHSFSRKPLSDRIHFLFTKQKSIPMKKLAYLSVLPILALIMMAFSFETVVSSFQKTQISEPKLIVSSDFKVYPKLFENKSIFTTITTSSKKNKIGMTISPRKATLELLNGVVANNFKEYGFIVKATKSQYNKSKKLEIIDISIVETETNKKRRDKSKAKVAKWPTDVTFDLTKMINKNPKELDGLIWILADKNTGEHFVVQLSPPPPPSMPPSPPPMPTKVKK